MLEDRCLFSASPLAAAVDAATIDPAQLDPAAVSSTDGSLVTPSSDAAALNMPLLDAPAVRHELIIVDQQIDHFQQLIDELNAASAPTVIRDIVTIDATHNGIEQITQLLAEYHDLDAIHILGHGAEQGLQFGPTWLTAQNIDQYASQFAVWGGALEANGDLLFYGCDVTATNDGVQLLQSIATWTEADIAASVDATGSSDLGGDWALEYQLGSIESTALSLDDGAWHGLLAGADALVNTTTTNAQQNPDIAVADNGNYVVVWQSQGQDGQGWGVYARLYNSSGTALTGEFQVNTTTSKDQLDPRVAMDSAGNFVVAWTSQAQDGDLGSNGNIYFQRYDSAGNALGGETLANNATSGNQQNAAVAYEHLTNTFAVTWSSDTGDSNGWGVYVRRFNANGTAIANQTLVNTTTSNDQRYSDIAGDDFGNYYIVWQSDDQDGSGWGAYGRYLSSTGSFVGGETRLNTITSDDQTRPTVEFDGQGNWLTAWVSRGSLFGDGVYARYFTYSSTGGTGGSEFLVNQGVLNDQNDPSIGHNSSRDFIITWTSEGQDGDSSSQTNVYGRLYERNGTSVTNVGNEFRVNVDASGNQSLSAVAMRGDGSYVVAFSGDASDDSQGVYAHRFADAFAGTAPVLSVNSTTLTYSDNSGPQAIDGSLTLTDVDSANLTGATITIRTGHVSSDDQLAFTNQSGITGAFNSTTGVLTLTGSASVANYEAALRSVTYNNTNTAPTNASRTIIFTVDDGTLLTSDARIVSVVNDNDAPLISNQAFSRAENSANGTVVGTVTVTDYDVGDTKSFTILAGNTGGAFAIGNTSGQITVASSSALNFEVTPTFTLTVQVTDGGGLSSTATVTVNLTNVNEAPTIASQSFAIDENSAAGAGVATVAASDVDAGDTKTYAITAGNTGNAFAINPTTGQITVATPALLNYEVTPTFNLSVRVTDAGGLSSTATVAVNLNNVNEAPTTSGIANLGANEDGAPLVVNYWNAFADPETADNGLTYVITSNSNPALFSSITFNAATGEATYSLAANAHGSTAVTVRATDPGGLSTSTTFNINVNPVNDAPTVTGATASIAENTVNGTLVTTVTGADVDVGDTLSYSIIGGNTSGAFAINGSGQITVANSAALDFETRTSFTLTVQARDSSNATGTSTVFVNLTNVNEAPRVINQTFSTAENRAFGTVVGTVAASDPDAGTSFTYSIIGGNPGGAVSLSASSGVVTIANPAMFDFEANPTITFTVQVADQFGLFDTATITVNLTNVNEVPTTTGIADVNRLEDGAPVVVNYWTAFADPETSDNGLTYSVVGNTNPGLFSSITFNPASGNATYTLTPNANGVAVVTVKATDPGGLFTTTSFTIAVAPVNDAPVASNEAFFVDPSMNNVSGNVLANDSDIDGGSLTVTLVVAPQNGTVTLAANGQFTYTTSSGFTGTDVFTYRVSDGNGGTANATVTLSAAASQGTSNASSSTSSSSSSSSSSNSSSSSSSSSSSASASSGSGSSNAAPSVAAASVPTMGPPPKVVEQVMSLAGVTSSNTNDTKSVSLFVAPRMIVPGVTQTLSDVAQTASVAASGYQSTIVARTLDTVDLAARQSQLALEGAVLDAQSLFAVQDSLGELDKAMKFDWLSHQLTIGSVAALSSGLSVGYVLWLIRGGLLLTSVMAQLPAWRIVDPLIVLETGLNFDRQGEAGESLASLLEQHDKSAQGAHA